MGSLRCASADPLSRPCYVGHRSPPTISHPIRSAVNTVDGTPHVASEVQVAPPGLIFAPTSRIWDQKRCSSSFEKHCRTTGSEAEAKNRDSGNVLGFVFFYKMEG